MLAYSTEQNGCIIWHTKHVSSYEARATKLMYHILRGKWDEPMARASPILNVLRGSLASCYTDQAPRTVSAFQSVFAVIWLFPTRLPACPTILEAFGRSLQLWYESLKVFAAVSVVCTIRHIYLSTRHLVRDSASDCKYRDGWRRSMFCFSDCSWMYFYFLSPERALHCWLLPVCTIAIVLEW